MNPIANRYLAGCTAASSRRRIVLLLAAGTMGASAALAQDVKPLTKAEVEEIAVGKKLEYVRTADGANVVFDIRSDGKAYYSPPRTQRNLSIQGAYTISDEGTLCFKWQADKYVTMQDGCYVFKRDDQKIHVYRARSPDSPIGDLVP